MNLNKNYKKYLTLVFFGILLVLGFLVYRHDRHVGVFAAGNVIYVDGNLASACTGNYSIANRNCSGTDGNAYKTILDGISHITSGMTMYIRSGNYLEKSGWTLSPLGSFSTMVTIAGYPGEMPVWRRDRADNFINLSETADNITFKDISFQGLRYVPTTLWTWQQYSGNVWIKTSNPEEYQQDLKSGCDQTTFNCTKTSRSYEVVDGTSCCADLATLQSKGADGDFFLDANRVMYIYSTKGSPQTRTDLWFTGMGIMIGNNSSSTGYIVVDHCTFDGNGHAALKGGYKWWVKNSTFHNIGMDQNDHDIYAFGVLSAGNEAVYENNYFLTTDPHIGAALHLFGGEPKYHIIRNNIISGPYDRGVWLYASNNTVTNNTMYLPGKPGGNEAIETVGNTGNVIENNIFMNYGYVAINVNDIASGYVVTNNITYGGGGFFQGNCTGCTVSNNKTNVNPGFVSTSPTTWSDFRLAAGSAAIDAGLNLGTAFQNGLNPGGLSWPPGVANQNSYGSGWDIGAYVYTGGINPTVSPTATAVPTPTPTLSPTVQPSPTPAATTGDTNGDGKVDGIDYVTVINHFGQTTSKGPMEGDLNLDGKSDLTDLNIVIANLFKVSSSTPTPTSTITPTATPTSTSVPTATPSSTTPPGTVILGDKNIETGVDYNSAGMAEAFVYTANSTASVSNISVYLDSTSNSSTVEVGIYSDSAGNPGSLLGKGIIISPTPGAWNSVSIPQVNLISGSNYWIAILGPSGSSGTVRFRDSSGSKSVGSSLSNLTTLSSTWTTGAVWSNSPASIYAY